MLAARAPASPGWRGFGWRFANLHRPGAPTPIVMLSLGLGLTVLVATALIEGNLREQITKRIPSDAPAFFVDIQSTQMPASEGAGRHPGAEARQASCAAASPVIGGKPVNEIAVPSDARWAIDGDRGAPTRRRRPRACASSPANGGRPTIAGRPSPPSTRRWPRRSGWASATPSR